MLTRLVGTDVIIQNKVSVSIDEEDLRRDINPCPPHSLHLGDEHSGIKHDAGS
jgi:hypothetical protein